MKSGFGNGFFWKSAYLKPKLKNLIKKCIDEK